MLGQRGATGLLSGKKQEKLPDTGSSRSTNSSIVVFVGTFWQAWADPNLGDPFTYQLVSGNNAFTIVGDQLLTNSSLDFETQSIYRIFVQTTDSTGASYSETLTINVNNVTESPTDLNLSNTPQPPTSNP